MSSERVIGTHQLDNGLALNFLDRSKQIAGDRWFVSVAVQVKVPVEKKWFIDDPMADIDFEHMQRELGAEVVFEQKKERNFMSSNQKDAVIEEICEGTLKTTKDYLGSKNFPAKFILKKFSEKMRKW